MSTQAFKSVIITSDDGKDFEVRQPSIKVRADIRSASTTISSNGTLEFRPFEFALRAAMACTYVPGTSDLVFSDEDFDVLSGMPSGGLIDDLSQAAADLCNLDSKESKKPSKPAEKSS